jgi:ketosteroid isomerase-like protein
MLWSLVLLTLSTSPRSRGEILSAEMADVVVTRVQRSGPPRRKRDVVERLMVRFPSGYRRLAAGLFPRLGLRSRLRRDLLRRAMISGWDAFYRQDFELILVRFSPDVEYRFNPGLQTLGLGGVFRGHEGMREAFGKLTEAWESWELDPAYILDLGERVVFLGFNRSRARGSGVTLEQEFAQLVTLRDGLTTNYQNFFLWEEALRAAGLDPDAIALPTRGKTGKAGSRASA